MELLGAFGPGGTAEPVARAEALAYVEGLARGHYENFSVLSSLVPPGLRGHFAAVYAFCRWSDDLGDETGADEGARARSLELLEWWEGELEACFAGRARHPVFVALEPTIEAKGLPIDPFRDLISAFRQDQTVRHYRTWEQLEDYCRRSANPVGRLVLMLAGYAPGGENAARYDMSDATCTALQLANFWQDVRRDLVERDRVYIPSDETGVTPALLRDWAGRGEDPAARVPFIKALRPLVRRTEEMFERGAGLPGRLDAEIAPVVWLFGAGGRRILGKVERAGCTSLWKRPRLAGWEKAALVGRAWAMSRLGLGGSSVGGARDAGGAGGAGKTSGAAGRAA